MLIRVLNGKKVPTGSRVVVLNTNVCNLLNFFIYGQRSDPGGQIAWLEQTLLEIETQGGLAIILGHITPNECQHQFGIRYRALMERFQHVVRFGL